MDEGNIKNKKRLQIFKSNWYWFVCSMIICLCISIIYLIWAPKVYLREATIMVQSDDYVINRESVHLNQPLMSFKNIMNDEVSILQSNRLMAETVRLLDLDMSYTIKGGIRVIELYTCTPILLHFL